jgi:hypothetical protein
MDTSEVSSPQAVRPAADRAPRPSPRRKRKGAPAPAPAAPDEPEPATAAEEPEVPHGLDVLA